jgi:mannose/cellobiose epimerase-like protein (N-acyl-D-glucosamine 2-epimerase family)
MEGMRRARRAGALVSFDLNLRPALWPMGVRAPPYAWPALHQADVVKLSAEEFAWLAVEGSDEVMLDRLWRGRHAFAGGDRRRAPIALVSPGRRWRIAQLQRPMVDSTAAGDAFVGGLLCISSPSKTSPPKTFDALDRHLAAPARRAAIRKRLRCARGNQARFVCRHARPGSRLSILWRSTHDERRIYRTSAPKRFLRDHIAKTMAFYHPRAIDPAGGFFHYFRDDGTVYDTSHRHLVSSTRFVFNYAMGAIEFRTRIRSHRATRVALSARCASRPGNRWLRMDHPRWQAGRPHQSRYGVAFVLLAYSTALKAGISEAAGWMDETWHLLEQRYWDPSADLYRDEADAHWKFSDYRGQNANMHMCEAMLAAYQASDDPRYLDRALLLAHTMTRRQAELAGGLVWEHYHTDWTIDWDYHRDDPKHLFRPWGFQPGHQTEWAKLLLIMEPLLLERGREETWLVPTARHLFDTA